MSRENVEIVRRFFDEAINRDPLAEATWSDLSDRLDPDFEYREDPGWPGAGSHRGIPAFRKVVTDYREAFGKMRLEAERIFDVDDRILVFIRFWARGANGPEAVMHQAGIFTVQDGRLASWQVIFDRDAALEAVGLAE